MKKMEKDSLAIIILVLPEGELFSNLVVQIFALLHNLANNITTTRMLWLWDLVGGVVLVFSQWADDLTLTRLELGQQMLFDGIKCILYIFSAFKDQEIEEFSS